jgi:hypothetical protein
MMVSNFIWRMNLITRIDLTSFKINTASRTAVEKGEGTLDNGPISQHNLFDVFGLSLMFWR